MAQGNDESPDDAYDAQARRLPSRDWRNPRAWLARFSFSFVLVGAVLAWEGYQSVTGNRGPVPQSRIVLYFAGALICWALGLAGVRERHRPDR
jgi:hypothetical protein